jgi:nicotinate-nucleotide pyrophosphorylase (carboxylating)
LDFYKNFDFKEEEKLIRLALKEDIGKGDITSEILIPVNSDSKAELLVKESGIIAGLEIFRLVYKIVSNDIKIKFFIKDGDKIQTGKVIGEISGSTRNLLMGERVSLNLLQRMSGIATLTDQLKRKLDNKDIKIIDTRKTTPNMRIFEKLGVKIGGGENHRMGLYDMVLIKDNHIEACGGISKTLEILRKEKSKVKEKVEIEVKNISELKKVIANGKKIIDRVMLDNFSIKNVGKAIELNKGLFQIEVSGGINYNNINKYSEIKGIDFISIGFLTHSVKSLDISLNFIT